MRAEAKLNGSHDEDISARAEMLRLHCELPDVYLIPPGKRKN